MGELDLAAEPELMTAVEQAEAVDAPLVEVDLRELAFIDSTGISCLLRLTEWGRRSGRRIEFLLGSHGPVDRALRLAGVRDLLPLAA